MISANPFKDLHPAGSSVMFKPFVRIQSSAFLPIIFCWSHSGTVWVIVLLLTWNFLVRKLLM